MKFNINNSFFKIRKIKRKDSQDYYLMRANNLAEIYISDNPFNSLIEAKNHLKEMYFTKKAKKTAQGYAVVDLTTNNMIGIIELHSYNPLTHSASIGYILDKAYWNQGIMSVAVKNVIALAFDKKKYFSLTATTKADNLASVKILNKLGFKLLKFKVINEIEYYHYKLERSSDDETKT